MASLYTEWDFSESILFADRQTHCRFSSTISRVKTGTEVSSDIVTALGFKYNEKTLKTKKDKGQSQ